MFAARLAVLAVVGAMALTATGVRIGDHPAYVRVVVDFNGKVPANQVAFDNLSDFRAVLRVAHPGIKTNTTGGTGDGVKVALQPGTQELHIAMNFASHRFKYLSYAVVTGNRLAIDLWKSAPPRKPSHTCSGLTLSSDWASNGREVSVRGRERGIFENQFQVVVRGENGAVLGRKSVHGPGRWATKVHYHVGRKQAGTVEAVVLSAKDGALECLAQQFVELPPN
jgi:hypothetical protein